MTATNKWWFRSDWWKAHWFKSGWFTGVGVTAPMDVWAATGTKRSLRTEAAGSGTTVTMKQARHESRAFQILARADGEVANFDIATAALSDGAGNTIAATNLHVYRGHQREVTQLSYSNPEGTLGWYPDGLLPTVFPDTGEAIPAGATHQALPYTLPADETHTFVVDVHVPKATVAGDYTGTITLSADDQDDVEIAVSLHVWNWTHPDTTSLRTSFSGPADALRRWKDLPGMEAFAALDADGWAGVVDNTNIVMANFGLSAMVKEHGASGFYPEGSETTWEVSAEEITALQTHIDAYNPSVYEVSGKAGISTYGVGAPDADGGLPAGKEDDLTAYLAAMDAGIAAVDRPDVLYTIFLEDEPWDYDDDVVGPRNMFVLEWGPSVYAAAVECLVATTVVPTHGEKSMVGCINTWALSLSMQNPAEKAEQDVRRAAGDKIWLYGGALLDEDILYGRVKAWICRHEDMAGMLGGGSSIDSNAVYIAGGDPWTQPVNDIRTLVQLGGTVEVHKGDRTIEFSSSDGADLIGLHIGILDTTGAKGTYGVTVDGTTGTLTTDYQGEDDDEASFYCYVFNGSCQLFLPCTEAAGPAQVGFNGMIPTLRALAVRDGVYDYNYFYLANVLGLGDEVDALVNALVEWDEEEEEWTWDDDADLYETARETLGDAIETASLKALVFDQGHLTGGMMAMAGGLA